MIQRTPCARGGITRTQYIHVYYRLVRLTEQVPPGSIGPVPNVTVVVNNDDPSATDFNQLFLTGISIYPMVTNCNIDAPSQVTLPDLYSANLVVGANMNTTPINIQLKNCPGAVNNITYLFAPADGTSVAADGIMKTAPGSAEGVYLRLTKGNGDPYGLNSTHPIDNYTGSGDYALPTNISYYVKDSVDNVRPGAVNEAIKLPVSYN